MSVEMTQAAFEPGDGSNLPVSDSERITEAATKLGQVADELAKARSAGDTQRQEELNKEREAQAEILQALKTDFEDRQAKAQADADAELLAWAKNAREPSKAHLVAGQGTGVVAPTMSGYAKGAFLYNLYVRNNPAFFDAERQEADANLRAMTVYEKPSPLSEGVVGKAHFGEQDASTRPADVADGGFVLPQAAINAIAHEQWAKATLGTTAATGGFIMPNAEISDIVKPARYTSGVSRVVNTLRVSAQLQQIPVRDSAPARAVVTAWGDTKPNTNLTYGGYTATMYTMARIYDLAKQFLRFSRGAAEQDVMQELAHAFELGKAYYTLQGSGSAEPYGIQTAIATQFGAFTSSFTAAGTLAGSIASAIATAAGALAVRNRQPDGALLGPLAYWTMLAQGTDNAGFFFAPAQGPLAIRGVGGTLFAPWGVPVYPESQLAGTDDLLVGEFSALTVYQGEAFRVDTSDVAGDRWDKNLVGFRGEEEIGLDARPAVAAGAFQFIADVLP